MSSTNKTTNYELSQFQGTDKPAWLSDYNQDMSKIDTGIHNAATTATGADGKADANTTAIGTLENLETTAKTSLVAAVNEVNTNADTAQTTATNAATSANVANTNINKFNLNTVTELSVSINKGSKGTNTHLYLAKDSTNSVFKLYGRIDIINLAGNTGNLTLTIGNTGLNPSTAYTVSAAGTIIQEYDNSQYVLVRPRSFSIATNGAITISGFPISLTGHVATVELYFPPCIYFNKDFGDAGDN